MDKHVRCSVVMATYNGELYIEEQIKSVLRNMQENDELIISDDGSLDDTKKIVQQYQVKDARIQLVNGPCKGAIHNFEHGLKFAKGSIIFLCDQDDIWEDNKMETVLAAMDEKVSLVMHDAVVVEDGKEILPSFMQFRQSKPGFVHNLLKNSYIGCCMAFRRELLKYILPFPKQICMHDQWIGLVNELWGNSCFIDDKLIRYRRHGNNASPMTGTRLIERIKNRVNMLLAVSGCIRKMRRIRKECS